MFSDSGSDETSFSHFYRLDAQITFAVDCFLDVSKVTCVSKNPNQNNQDKNMEPAKRNSCTKKSKKDRIIYQDSGRDLKRLLSDAAMSIMNICFDILKRGAVASKIDVECKLSFKPIWSEIARLQNGERKLTMLFNMPSYSPHYIVIPALAFKNYVL